MTSHGKSAAKPASTARKLERRLHDAFGGIPYFDEELQLPASEAHRTAVFELGTILETLATESGLRFASDHPIWYFHPETDEQRWFCGDLVITRPVEVIRITAEDLLVVIEVVSTQDRRKEIKDSVFQRAVNEYNGVPEFGLLFPDVGDGRSLVWFTLDQKTGRYDEVSLSPGGEVEVAGLPGVTLRVKPVADWEPGRKLEVRFNGKLQRPLRQERERAEAERERAEAEHERAEAERERAEAERERAEAEHERAEAERERAERLAEKLRSMGIDPDE